MARETLIDLFQDFSRLDAPFLTFDDGYRSWTYSYEQVAGAAARFAERLLDHGIERGDKVIFWSENRAEWIAAFWGCLLRGVVAVPVDYRSSPQLLERIGQIVKARVVLAGDEVQAAPDHWKLAEIDWTAAAIQPLPAAKGDLCEIVFTSGATADPKGVTITHANILANLVPVETEIRKHRRWSIPFAPIRFLNLLPLSHMFGQSMATFIPPVLPGEVVFMRGYNPREIVRQIRSRRISVLVSVPKILEGLRDYVVLLAPEAAEAAPLGAGWVRRWWHYRRVHNLFGWKFWSFVVGAAPLDPALEEFWSNLGFVVVQGYGLTETAPIVTLNHPFHTSKGSVGKPIGGVEVKIADDGEILVRGANVTAGYFHGDSAAFAGGWFHTGDLGALDADGRVFIRGRKKEVIVTPDGMNVIPEDVERVLNGVAGVRESAVVGAGPANRERVHAVLVLARSVNENDVIGQANRQLESHQQIQGASTWPGEALPRTEGTEKLKRAALREWVAGGAAPGGRETGGGAPLAEYADKTPLTQIGLSSLDRVELMMRMERQGEGSIDESAFREARTVGELRSLARRAESAPAPAIVFPRWNRSFAARTLRRVTLPLVLLPLLRVFAWVRASGREHLTALRGPALFVSNHQSILDVPALLAALTPQRRYRVATAMGMDWFAPHFHPERFGWFTRLGNSLQYFLVCLFFNAFPIPQHAEGTREALRYMGELVSEGWSILLFPEGVRTQAGEIGSFQPGAGMIGSRLKLPVVPMRLEGLEKVLHQNSRVPHPGVVRVGIGPALVLAGEDYAELAKRAEQAVRSL